MPFYAFVMSGLQLQGFGVIGDSAEGPQEVEGEPALSLTLGVLPGVSTLTHITAATANLDPENTLCAGIAVLHTCAHMLS